MKTNNCSYVRNFIPVLLLFFIFGCSGSKYPYDIPVKMQFDSFIRDSHKILPEIPEGWFVAEDESIPNNISILLLENHYRAAIILSEIKISKNANEVLRKYGLKELAAISFEMKDENSKDSLFICKEPEIYEIRDSEFIAYDYKKIAENDSVRVLIFKTTDTYFELSSLNLNSGKHKASVSRDSLLSVQYSVLRYVMKK